MSRRARVDERLETVLSGRVLQNPIGAGHKCVFFAIHLAIFLDEDQAVDVGIADEANVIAALSHQAADFAEVLLQRLGVVRKIARRFPV